jgi:uncharacterized repeat protein (TIGR01451 family)
MMPVQIDDPVQLSPYLQPLDDAAAARLRASRGIAVYGYRPRITSEPMRVLPEGDYSVDRANGAERARGPLLAPGATPAVQPIVLTVTADKSAQVGNGVTFDIVARNPNAHAVTDVVVVADFDEALTFPGHPEKKVRRSLGTLAAGETRTFAVMLSSETTGRHCTQFTVTVDEIEVTSKLVCVEYIANDLEISILGPANRTVGSRAEFTIKLQNRATRELSGVEVVVTYGKALEPREGSTGAKFEKQSLRWDLQSLQPGEFVQLQIEFECVSAVKSTCVVVDVTSQELPDERKAQCLQVDELSGPLQVELRDTSDPIAIGETTEHVVTVLNRSKQTVSGIRLTALVPQELGVVSTTVRLDGNAVDVSADIDDDRIVFGLIKELPAGSTLTFHIKSKAQRDGDATFTVSVTYPRDDGALVVNEPISVNAD